MSSTTTTAQQQSQEQEKQQEKQQHKVPPALRPLLEAFARETLRGQPKDLVQFGAVFFDVLQKQKNNVPSIEALFADKVSYDTFRTELHQKLKTTAPCTMGGDKRGDSGGGMNCAEQLQRPHSPMDIAATKIQAAFRGHRVRAHPEKFGLDPDTINGINQKQKMRRNSNERLFLADNRKDLKRHSVGGYSHDAFATPEDRAATKIQAEIRGFLTRKHVEEEKKSNQEAATKIQAHIRGFLTRKHLEEQGIVLSPPRSRSSTQVSIPVPQLTTNGN